MREDISKMLQEAEEKGDLHQKITLLWGADGLVVFSLGERSAWRRAHAVVRIKMLTCLMIGIGLAELIRAIT